MKKIAFLFLLVFAVNSCSSDDSVSSDEVLLPILSVVMPNSYVVDSASTIMITYSRPTDCHIFNGFYINNETTNSIVGIKALKFNQQNCMNDDQSTYEVPLYWTPTVTGEYVMKFWTGNNTAGEPEYIEQVILVE